MPVVHAVGIAIGSSSAVAVGAIVVRAANELAPALAQHEKPVIIDNAELAKPFSRLAYWQEARWWFISFLVYTLLAYAIASKFSLEVGWRAKWKAVEIGGKVTLTPKK